MDTPHVIIEPKGAQKNALMAAQHVSQRRHAHDQIYAAKDWSLEQGKTTDEFAVVVIDLEDPWMPDAIYEKLAVTEVGYRVEVNLRSALAEALKKFTMPTASAGLRWEHSARVWVDEKSKPVRDFAPSRPYLKTVPAVLEPASEGHFLVVSFTRNSVDIVEMPLVKPPLEDPDPKELTEYLIAAQKATEEGLGQEPAVQTEEA